VGGIAQLEATEEVRALGKVLVAEGLRMWRDPMVEETRKRREECAAKFKHDADAIFDDIRKRQRERGKKLVSFPARRPTNKPTAA
jgi:hypothetical protein